MRFGALLLCVVCVMCSGSCSAREWTGSGDANVAKVPVELYVLSKCPDALYAEDVLAPVLADLKNYIDLSLHFIGVKQDDDTWTSKHGKEEEDGDLQQLCVQLNSKVYQRYDWLYRFVICNNKDVDSIGSFATAAKCLKEAGIPLAAATKMLGCMYGPTHAELLADEFEHTAATGISVSATIVVDGNIVCVRDGGEWKDCPAGTSEQDFKELLCASYAAKNRGRLPPTCRPAAAAAWAAMPAVQ